MKKTKIAIVIKSEEDIDNTWELFEISCRETYKVVAHFLNLNEELYNLLKDRLDNLSEIKMGNDSGYGNVPDSLKYEFKIIENFSEKRKTYHVKYVKIKE